MQTYETRQRVPVKARKKVWKKRNPCSNCVCYRKIEVYYDRIKQNFEKMKSKQSFSEMFGLNNTFNRFSVESMKRLNIKYRIFQFLLFLFFLFLSYVFFYTIDLPHFELRLPDEKDLSVQLSLRNSLQLAQKKQVLLRVVAFLEDSCDAFPSYTLLFCQNVMTNKKPIIEPCFIDCRDKTFYYDLDVETTENSEVIKCNEAYGDTSKTMTRKKNVIITGRRNFEMEEFKNIPNSSLESCIMQHGIDISKRQW